MTCKEYEVLLNSLMEGTISGEAREAMALHEQTCPDCRALRAGMEALRDDLASLGEDEPVPAMPNSLHQRWMERVKEDAMENREAVKAQTVKENEKETAVSGKIIRLQPRARRVLAWAAALVFVVGGTLLTRDDLPARTVRRKAGVSDSTYASTSPAVMEDVEEIAVESADADYGMPMLATGASYDSGAGYNSMPAAMAEMAEMEEAPAEGAGETRASKIIRNVSLTMTTRQFDDTLATLKAACESAGGRVSWENMTVGSGSLRRVNLTLRIPAEALDGFLAGTEGLGRITAREETASDVTDSYYDTASRLQTQRDLMARLRSLMTETASLTELLQLESQIADTQYTIDRLQASLNSTDSKVSESTVSITLREEKEAETIVNQDATFLERLGSALSAGFNAFRDFAEDMAVFLVAALPFIAIVAVCVLVFRILRRRHRRAKKKKEN